MSEFPLFLGDQDQGIPDQNDALNRDLYGVGPNKPMGNFGIDRITQNCGRNVEDVVIELQARGLYVQQLGKSKAHFPALYVYDKDALTKLLEANNDAIAEADWPQEADAFIERVHEETAPTPALYVLVAKAFNDPRLEIPGKIEKDASWATR